LILQAALNAFFDETSIFNSINQPVNKNQINNKIFTNMNMSNVNSISSNAPSNTPVTPPNVDYLEKAFSQLNSSLEENPTTSSKFGFSDYTSDLRNTNFNPQFNFNHSGSNNTNLDCEMLHCVSGKKANQLPFCEQTYRDSARFNFYNN